MCEKNKGQINHKKKEQETLSDPTSQPGKKETKM